ncbi:hypothetical protein, partial [Vibrio parahaemolyticus]|uniref:hypothetical protein n=1 Tax=Vibrio parahaemolyticus TaxID=670 RepID=UPI00116F7460
GHQPNKAIIAITKVSKEDVNHWLLYEKSKAYLELGKGHYEEALTSSKECFESAKKDQSAQARISIYHDLLSSCYMQLNDIESSIRELRDAIKNCSNEKYRAELEIKLADITQC